MCRRAAELGPHSPSLSRRMVPLSPTAQPSLGPLSATELIDNVAGLPTLLHVPPLRCRMSPPTAHPSFGPLSATELRVYVTGLLTCLQSPALPQDGSAITYGPAVVGFRSTRGSGE